MAASPESEKINLAQTPSTKGNPAIPPKVNDSFGESLRTGPGDSIPYIFLFLYVIVGLIPSFGAFQVTGTQWLYVSGLNILAIIYITWKKDSFYPAARMLTRSLVFIVWISLFVIAGLSILFAFNKTESIVSYARFANTITAFLVFAIFLYKRDFLFTILAQVITGILLYETLKALFPFFRDLATLPFDELILNLKGNTGNKNLLAASLVIKLPFALYTALNSKWMGKLFCSLIIGAGAFAIFIINSRSAYLAFIVILLQFLVFLFIRFYKKVESLKRTISQFAFIIVPLIISFLFSWLIIKNNIENQETPSAYGTVTERLASIGFSDKSSNARNFLWANAIDFIKKKPLTGCGYGNWKLKAISYDRFYFNDFIVSYNVHNDLLEMTAESGIIAGFLWLALFGSLAIYVMRTWRSGTTGNIKTIAFFSFMALSAYFIDALLNFPHEMAFMQVYLALSAALIVNCFFQSKEKADESFLSRKNNFAWSLLPWLLLSISVGWICFQTYRSMLEQSFVDKDLKMDKPGATWESVNRKFPSLPDLNAEIVPIDLFRAIYLVQDKKYDEALGYLEKSDKSNPWIGRADLLRSRIYDATNRPDSAYAAAIRGYFAMPRALPGFRELNNMCYKMKDTLMLNKVFHEFIKYRNESWVWRDYITYMQWLSASQSRLLSLTDSALTKFPEKTYWPQIKAILVRGDTLLLVPHVGEDR